MSPNAAAAALETNVVECPKCRTHMQDVRARKGNPRSPDWVCASEQCRDERGYRTAVWGKDLARLAAKAPNGARSRSVAATGRTGTAVGPHAERATTPASSFDAVASLHARCLAYVIEHEKPALVAAGGDVARAVACCANSLFIEVTRRGGQR